MATNRELKDRAIALGAKPEEVENKSNALLTELVAKLEAPLAPPVADPAPPQPSASKLPVVDGADDGTGGPPKAKPGPKPSRFPLSIAPRKAITSDRGILSDGAQVRVDDFAPELLEDLIARGFIIDQRPKPEAAKADAGGGNAGGSSS